MRRYFVCLILLSFLTACSKKDDPSSPPAAAPPAGQPTPTTAPPPGSTSFVIFDDELKSGGGAFLYPGGDNQALSFNETTNPASGTSCIRYAWNGGDTAGQHVFVGMDLMHVGDLAQYAATPGKDLRSGAYQNVIFDARGSLTANVVVKIEVADDGNQMTPPPCIVLSTSGSDNDATPLNPGTCSNKGKLLATWQRYTLTVTASDLASVKDYFKATFINKNGDPVVSSGGTVFFDNITYRP